MPEEPLKSELRKSFSFSQSSLQDYFDCPRRFQLKYIEQLAWPAVEAEPVLENERRQQAGRFFHRMVQQYLIGLPAEKLDHLANVPDLKRWWENWLDFQKGNLFIKDDDYAKFSELTLVARVEDYRLLAKYDLVTIKPKEQAIIFDWKTSQKRPRGEWLAARMQTRVYRALMVQAGAYLNGGTPFQPEQVSMVYWYADFSSDPVSLPYSAAQYQRDWDALTGLIHEIGSSRHFPLAEDEKKCAYCPYRSYCGRGEKAGTLDEAEAEMETESSEFDLNFEQVAEIEF